MMNDIYTILKIALVSTLLVLTLLTSSFLVKANRVASVIAAASEQIPLRGNR